METQNHIEAYQPLFEHMADEHEILLVKSELDEIIRLSEEVRSNYDAVYAEATQNDNEIEYIEEKYGDNSWTNYPPSKNTVAKWLKEYADRQLCLHGILTHAPNEEL